jgi:hypothetical protein
MNIKLSNTVLALFIINACTPKKNLNSSVVQFNHLATKEKTVILSCIKCKCIIDELNGYQARHKIDTMRFDFYGDTTCFFELSKAFRINHLPQKYVDSCSVEFYNMLVLTKRNNIITAKEVATKEARKLPQFFE